MNKWNIEDLGALKILCDIGMVGVCHYVFVQTLSMYTTKSEP